ncbi:unnamed protein product [Brassicogethes aeneus]|uniref:Epoxide hydrolase n=1 Tax=Brassicogethes aeneus TaxID=1431903 RepID=A0A9P0ARP3_BRAAE|nr:unnamed protein product [Brassicogethes aeneus]
MGLMKSLVSASLVVIFLAVLINNALKPPAVPKIEATWWGPGEPSKQDKSIRPFTINISEKEIQDLNHRLDFHRPLTPPLEGTHQQYGMNTNLLKEIIEFWRKDYKWKEREAYFNKFPQFKTNIQGLDIHYLHVKPKKIEGVKVLPLIILHGWPGSVREFLEIIPILTTPKNGIVFEVVAPHIPGYGFSQAAVRPGCGAAQIAVVMKNLMHRLGFSKFYAQGGDFGSIILQHLSVLHPESVLGFHSNMCVVNTKKSYLWTLLYSLYPQGIVKQEHVDRMYPLSEAARIRILETGYLHLQATKPDTLGVGLNDSPVALASYILEKFVTGTNKTWQEIPHNQWKKDWISYTNMLDNIMIYWWTNSMNTAFRLYAETFNIKHNGLGIMGIPIPVPTACARFENDFYVADGLVGEVHPNLVQLTDHPGGHFAALQLPQVLAEDIFSAVKIFEKVIHKN